MKKIEKIKDLKNLQLMVTGLIAGLLVFLIALIAVFLLFPPFGLSAKELYHTISAGIAVFFSMPTPFHVAKVEQFDIWIKYKDEIYATSWYSQYYLNFFMSYALAVYSGAFAIYKKVNIFTLTQRFINTSENLNNSICGKAILKQSKKSNQGIYVADINNKPFYTSIEDRVLFFGPPGVGKTAFMLNSLIKWMETKRCFIAIDIKSSAQDQISEILKSQLKKHGYKVCIINPTQAGKGHYNPLDDAKNPEAIAELAACLIPNVNEDVGVFTALSRNLVEAVVSHLRELKKGVSFVDVYKFISNHDSVQKLLDTLANSQAEIAKNNANVICIAAQSERLMGSVFATILSFIRVFQYENIADTFSYSDFSLNELGQGYPVAIFLQFVEERFQTTERLLSLLIGHIFQYLMEYTEREEVLFLADEIGNCPVISNFVQRLNTIRSRKIPLMMFFQTLAQMDKYGVKSGEGSSYIMASADCKITFRLNDSKTQEDVSKLLGQYDKEITTSSVSYQGIMGFISKTRAKTKTPRLENVVRPADLGKLEDYQTVLIYKGNAVKARATPYFDAYKEYYREK